MSSDLTENSFFIGANSAAGFENLTSSMTKSLSKLYIIKGGAGTGKSTLMKRFASSAMSCGYAVNLFFCSSDSTSLDGVSVPELGLGIIDGTSPHSLDPRYAGAVESIINLGQFWNEDILIPRTKEIVHHTEEKSRLFGSAYKHLSVISALHDEQKKILTECADMEKCRKVAARIISGVGEGKGFCEQRYQISAIGMNGITYLNSYEKMANTCLYISDKRGFSGIFLDTLMEYIRESKLSAYTSKNPLCEYEAIYLPEKRLAIVTGHVKDGCKVINTERFTVPERLSLKRGKLRLIKKLKAELYGILGTVFEEISREHFALESIYKEAMDFSKVTLLTDELIRKHFKR